MGAAQPPGRPHGRGSIPGWRDVEQLTRLSQVSQIKGESTTGIEERSPFSEIGRSRWKTSAIPQAAKTDATDVGDPRTFRIVLGIGPLLRNRA